MPRRVALIISSTRDIHAAAVSAWIGAHTDAEVAILDSADFPERWRLSAELSADGIRCRLASGDWSVGDEALTGVWWRRPRRHAISPSVTDRRARRFCRDEAAAAFQGWLLTLGSRVLNPIGLEYMADRKLYQLHVARRLGLFTPETLVTNDPHAARDFIERMGGRAVFKILTGTTWRFTETRAFEESLSPLLETVALAPVIFQALVEAERHIRATVVDGEVFCCSVRPIHPGARVDWRLDLAAEIEPHDLPQTISDGLAALMRALGLRYGAIDMILQPDGRYAFLEVNTAGQYLFGEIHAGLPITAAVGRALIEGPPAQTVSRPR
jgi:hypothetical protein